VSLQTVFGQPSTRIATAETEAWVTRSGGHVGPITFRVGDRNLTPMHVAPWADESWAACGPDGEPVPANLTPSMQVLRGDFFCMPFGGNAAPWNGEKHPLHGESANGIWDVVESEASSVRLALDTTVRRGRIEKEIHLVPGHSMVYSRHTISGMTGPMTLGHHPMLRCQTPGLVSVAPFKFGQVFTGVFEAPLTGGYSALQPHATFSDLAKVPAADGQSADLTRYPARRGYEDFVMMYAAPEVRLGWSAVVFPEEGFVWFSLKDPRVLSGTALWMSNGGRHYEPWNGRHVNVLGIEEVTSSVATGLADSLSSTLATEAGAKTVLTLDPNEPTVVNFIFGVALIPAGFDHVERVEPVDGGVVLHSRSGQQVEAAVNLDHLGYLG